MTYYRKLSWVPSILFCLGCSDLTEDTVESLGESKQAIIGGKAVSREAAFNSLVAVYHKNSYGDRPYDWYQRPCTGTFLNGGWVITARHCVTIKGEVTGNLVNATTDIALNVSANPGYGSPPQNSFGIAEILEMNDTGVPDVVLLRVGDDSHLNNGTYPSLATGTPYAGQTYEAFGYGRNQKGTSPTSSELGLGAGVLRSAVLRVATVEPSSHMFTFTANAAGQIVYHGDSGGPSFRQVESGGIVYTEPTLLSIHSTVSSETYIYPELRNGIADVALFDINMYQFWNGSLGDHFYHTSSTTPDPAWVYEGAAFRLAHPGTAGSVPFYRFWNGSNHFYTTDFAEGANAGFTYESTPGNVFPTGNNGYASVVPLYRYYSPSLGDHYYTTNAGTYSGWNYELIAGYVHTSN